MLFLIRPYRRDSCAVVQAGGERVIIVGRTEAELTAAGSEADYLLDH
jgi:hypothetical protein